MSALPSHATRSYPHPLDAIVLAGTDLNPRRMIRGQNKAFLEVGGVVLVRGVVDALLDARLVDHVFVVGPAERLGACVDESSGRVTLVEQAGAMLANAWAAISAAEARRVSVSGQRDDQRPLLVISCDLPLISGDAIDDFIQRCAAEDARAASPYAMLTGVAEERSLRPYYPAEGRSGVVRPYVNLDRYRVRLANIYVGRPRLLRNQAFLDTGFNYRKAERWKNVLLLTWKFLSQNGGFAAAWLAMKLQLTLVATRHWPWLGRRMRPANTQERVEQVCSRVLGGSVRMVITPYGGLSLDADNENDFAVLSERIEQWKRIDPVPFEAGK
jgi:molybdopterin-guanine dinucleotide biosynthesis protein A